MRLEIQIGEHGLNGTPLYSINGFEIEFDELTGGTGPGERLVAVGYPQSFPHNLVLLGPEQGVWDIAGIMATYEVAGEPPYTVHLGAVTLDEQSNLNLWYERPARVVDV
jgi:hypothetical protein